MDISWTNQLDQILEKNGFINIGHEALDVHLDTPRENKVAIRFIESSWPKNTNGFKDFTYRELFVLSNRCSNALLKLGIKKGDVVFSLVPRLPEFYTMILGTLRAGGVFSPLFSVFGPLPIESRFNIGNGKVLLTLSSYYQKKIAPIRDKLPTLEHLIIINDDGNADQIPNSINFEDFMKLGSDTRMIEKTKPDDLALLHFTSGTTGKPKGAMHVHEAVVYHKLSGKWVFDFDLEKTDGVFWCTADPGWITGTSYGIISPLCNGVTLLVDQAEFNAERWYTILQNFKVKTWYTSPTAMRMLMKAGDEVPQKFDLSSVQFAASVGEPLNPEVIFWCKKNLGILLHDNWWQTETGGILIANSKAIEVRPGSMGKPMPGIFASIVEIKNNKLEELKNDNEVGQLAIRKGWPSMFRGYLGDTERYKKCFIDNWYLTGDLAKKDQDGYFWFVGRMDDVIKTSGHLIGPFEVESVLMEHSAILESAVIGIPDTIAGEFVKAFVVLKAGYTPSLEQKLEILAYARKRLGVAVAPREISFIENLPKTKSGKIMRRLLKARELGLAEGDLSTLETN